ncbi:hypothetical protein [Paraburkholderia sp. J63]|uniref:hypothetical protein n=1 Tax=Paraburkholderia sp. J63 TaxID=2805434 RepID=UPI002ABDC6B0|nr:hypothetical protein [Paraburkholderia sp. J63]
MTERSSRFGAASPKANDINRAEIDGFDGTGRAVKTIVAVQKSQGAEATHWRDSFAILVQALPRHRAIAASLPDSSTVRRKLRACVF